MEVLSKLKESNKGQLSYERKTDFARLTDDLKQCTSPSLGNFSSIFHTNLPIEEKLDVSDESKDESCEENILITDGSEDDIQEYPTVPTYSVEYIRSKLAIKECEAYWDNKIKLALKKKILEFHENEKNLKIKAEMELEDLCRQEALRDSCRYEELKAQQKQLQEEGERYQQLLREQHIHHNETAYSKFQEAKLKRKQLEEAAKKDREKKLEQLREQQKKILSGSKAFTDMLSQCPYTEQLSDKASKSLEIVTKLSNMSTALLAQAESTGGATNEQLNEAIIIIEQLVAITDKMKQIIEETDKKCKEQQQQPQQQPQQQQQHSITDQHDLSAAQNPVNPIESLNSTINAPKKQENDNEENKALERFSQFVDPEALKEYLRLQDKLKEVETNLGPFLNNQELKDYKFQIRKAANILINAISPLSGAHLKDKLNKLTMLLQGQKIEVSNRYISAKEQPEGITFAKYLVAKMLVKKGAEQVSSSHESAYAIATVAVGLWSNFPDLGELLLANFHLACPYIVPYYIPQEDGQSTEVYQKILGYKYESGKIEDQEKFLTRMTGIIRLYAAIMVSPMPPGVNKPHPHGIENCWTWVSRTLNIDPRPDITAAVLYNLLEVIGHNLFTNYRKPFQKLLHILITEFLPKIKAVSPSVGSVSRLETFLEANIQNRGQIAKPTGLISSSFWLTT